MTHKKFWAAAGRIFAVVTVALVVVLVLAPTAGAQSQYNILHRFHETNRHPDGTFPMAAPVLGADGNLYGTTEYGWGSDCYWHGCGSVFKLVSNPDGTWTETNLSDTFFDTDTGSWPVAQLIFDVAGNLYGTAVSDHTAVGDYSCVC